MFRDKKIAVCVAIFGACSAQLAFASPTTSMQTPAGLAPGQTFRFIYETTSTTDSSSSDRAYYNSFVNTDASTNGYTTYGGSAITWYAVASVGTSYDTATSAKDVITTEDPIYSPNGSQIVTTTSKLFDNLSGIALINAINPDAGVTAWTGSNSDGTIDHPLGSGNGSDTGRGDFTDYSWIHSGSGPVSGTYAIYAVSQELTVASVPEPASLALIGVTTLGLLTRRRAR